MSFESDLISEELQLSPLTISERYTDEDHSGISPIPEIPSCEYCNENNGEHEQISCTSHDGEEDDELPDDLKYHNHHECCTHCECPTYHHHYRSRFLPHWSTITMSDDDIEIIADPEYYQQFDDVFYIDHNVARSLLSEYLKQEPEHNVHIAVDTRTERQRFIARVVMVISIVMFTVSALLVIISLIMSDHIDNLVRSANSLLKVSTPSTHMIGENNTLIMNKTNETVNNSTDFG